MGRCTGLGRSDRAAAGKLVIFCGGDSNDIERARALFDAMAQRVTHFGAAGNGQAAKVCNQVIVAVSLTAIAESLNLAEAMSLDPLQLVEALTGGYADSIPLQIFGRRMWRNARRAQARRPRADGEGPVARNATRGRARLDPAGR